MSTKVQIIGGAFQDATGNPLANGYLLMELSQDGQVNSNTEIAAGFKLKIPLDSSGNIITSPAQFVWPNDVISPANTFYIVSAYTFAGQLVWGPNAVQVFSTPSPFPIGTWNPGGALTPVPQVITYDIGCFVGQYTTVQTLALIALERSVRFAANMVPSTAACGVAPTGSVVFSIQKNGIQFATVTFSSSTTTGVYSSTLGSTFVAGDILTIVAPVTVDSTMANIGFLLSGTALN
jgi:hypothetical protein